MEAIFLTDEKERENVQPLTRWTEDLSNEEALGKIGIMKKFIIKIKKFQLKFLGRY